jgi:hypothetical protein
MNIRHLKNKYKKNILFYILLSNYCIKYNNNIIPKNQTPFSYTWYKNIIRYIKSKSLIK